MTSFDAKKHVTSDDARRMVEKAGLLFEEATGVDFGIVYIRRKADSPPSRCYRLGFTDFYSKRAVSTAITKEKGR